MVERNHMNVKCISEKNITGLHFNRFKKYLKNTKNSPKKDKYSFALRIKFINIHV